MIIRAEAKNIFAKMQADQAGDFPCAGRGTCCKCKIRVIDGLLSEPTMMDRRAFSDQELTQGYRLACCLRGDQEVEAAYLSPQTKGPQDLEILSEGKLEGWDWNPVIKVNPLDQHLYFDSIDLGYLTPGKSITCLAVDIGTTTIVVSLIDLTHHLEMGVETAVNPQIVYGQDVMSRLSSGQNDPQNFVKMQEQVLHTIEDLGKSLLMANGYEVTDLYGIFVASNAVMNHILLGFSPLPLGFAPYPLQFEGKFIKTFKDLNLELFGSGYLVCLENISAYVGGDVMAGIISTQLGQSKETELLVDIGTNGEMVLARQGKYYSTSCAAGPALEGMNIACGMMAQAGAIEEARFVNGRLRIQTILRQKPRGICGSGILALIREFLKVGLITSRGRIADPDQIDSRYKDYIAEDRSCLWVDNKREIYISQKDIRQIQMAKGAILSGVQCLLAESQTEATEVDKVLIAGQFGSHVSQASLLGIEMIPQAFLEKIDYVGNTSKTGAMITGLSQACYSKTQDLLTSFYQIDLSSIPGYDRIFAKACLFPKLEEDQTHEIKTSSS